MWMAPLSGPQSLLPLTNDQNKISKIIAFHENFEGPKGLSICAINIRISTTGIVIKTFCAPAEPSFTCYVSLTQYIFIDV